MYFKKKKCVYFSLHWILVSTHGLSLVAASRNSSLLPWVGFSLWWLLLLRNMGSRLKGSVVVVYRLSCLEVFGIFLD